jgi:transcriptional regulator with XRE-family HTH domain
MADVKELLGEVQSDPDYAQALAVVELVREVGDMLAQMRTRAGLTQAELAERLDISAGRVSQLESGTLRNAPSLKTIAQFATACGEAVKLSTARGGASQATAEAADRQAAFKAASA